jgi:Na+/H+ antiporter NhaD/arsenite permease-like protein
MLSVVTAFVSALLDNVTTVLLIAPVTLEIARYLDAPPYPFLFAEVFQRHLDRRLGNLAVAGIAERNRVDFRFTTYTKHAFGLMLISVAISHVYLCLRYL